MQRNLRSLAGNIGPSFGSIYGFLAAIVTNETTVRRENPIYLQNSEKIVRKDALPKFAIKGVILSIELE